MGNPQLVDISSWQSTAINWPAYAAWSRAGDGTARVIIRASQGVGYKDANFEAFWAGALAAGVEVVGCYHYAYPGINPGQQGAWAEADWFTGVVGPRLRRQDFLMLDYEEQAGTAQWALDFLSRVQANYQGRWPRIYASLAYVGWHLQDARLANYPLILADWTFDPFSRPAAPAPWTKYEYLQYTDRLSVPGIPGVVDADVFISPVAPAAGLGGGKVLIPHPTQAGRLDLLYTGTDGHIWHNWSGGGIAGLAAHAAQFSETWGAPAGKTLVPLSASGCWDNGGQQLSIVVLASDGSLWGKALDVQGGLVSDWVQIAGQVEEVPTAGTPDDDSGLDKRVTAIETALSGVKAALP